MLQLRLLECLLTHNCQYFQLQQRGQSRVAEDTYRGKTPQQIFGGQTQRLADLEGKLLRKLLMLLTLGFQMPLAALAKTPLQ